MPEPLVPKTGQRVSLRLGDQALDGPCGDASPGEHLGGHSGALAEQPQQEVVGGDPSVPQPAGLSEGEFQHFLRPGCERQLPGGSALTSADDLLHRRPAAVERHAEVAENPERIRRFIPEQTEQEVLRPNVMVLQRPGLLCGVDNSPLGLFGEALEHPAIVPGGQRRGTRNSGG